MLVLKQLTAQPRNQSHTRPGVHHHLVGKDLGKGAFRTFELGPDGVYVSDGTQQLMIPIEELAALAETHFAHAGK